MPYLKKLITETEREQLRKILAVRSTKLSEEPVCDFCGIEDPVVIFGSFRMSSGRLQRCWRWTACEFCKELADRDDWDGLIDRMTPKMRELCVDPLFPGWWIRDALAQAVREFVYFAIPEDA